MFVAIIVSRCRILWFHRRCGCGSGHCCCRPHYHHQSHDVIDTLALRQSRWCCVWPHAQTASSLHVYIYCQIEFLLISSYDSDATRTHTHTNDARKFGKCSVYGQIYRNTKYRPTSRCCWCFSHAIFKLWVSSRILLRCYIRRVLLALIVRSQKLFLSEFIRNDDRKKLKINNKYFKPKADMPHSGTHMRPAIVNKTEYRIWKKQGQRRKV